VFDDSLAAACRYGLLEREVVLSILNQTPAWPTYQTFELETMVVRRLYFFSDTDTREIRVI
jgi:hypothetical protein